MQLPLEKLQTTRRLCGVQGASRTACEAPSACLREKEGLTGRCIRG
ncbi:hypothetical protein [Butyricicoccus sp. Marseille-Q5471]|nr:hypothetical protein [Butyricicoccus sp. Marseille-Q5471]